MARYNITGINYAALGEHRSFINLDLELDYELYDLVHLLCAEAGTSGYASLDAKSAGNLSALSVDIGTEHGEGFWHKTQYIQKGDDTPHSLELCSTGIVLNEQQDDFEETDPSKRDYIRLFLSCCTDEMKQKIIAFNNERLKTNMTFLADNTANDKNNLTCNGVKVLPLYDIKDVSLKKLGLHAQQNFSFHDVDRHHDVYVPQMSDPAGFCQTADDEGFGDDAVLLTRGTTDAPALMRTDFQSSTSQSQHYNTKLSSGSLPTYTYQLDITGKTAVEIFTPERNYQGVQYSYVVGLPTGVKSTIASDVTSYDDGVAYFSQLLVGKNALNAQYSMQMSSDASLDNCRTYVEIKSVGGSPYLKYYDDVSYEAISSVSATQVAAGATPLQLKTQQLNSVTRSSIDYVTKPFQKIEFVYPTSYSGAAKHKSNLYSVELSGTGILTESQAVEKEIASLSQSGTDVPLSCFQKRKRLEDLKFTIENAIRDIAKNVAPANTQLFGVRFTD